MSFQSVDSENRAGLDLRRIETTVPDIGAPITMCVGDMEPFCEQYAPAFIDLAKSADQVYGLILDSGKVVISDTANHHYINLARIANGYDGDVKGRFQIENRGIIPEFLLQDKNGPKFDYIFLSLEHLGDLDRAYEFLGIDRNSHRQAVGEIRQRYKNTISSESVRDFELLDKATWHGLFNSHTKVVFFTKGRIIQDGFITSIDKQKLVSGLEMESDFDGILNEFSLVYDPQTDRLVGGEGHDDAHSNLGHTNYGIKCLENWTPRHLEKWNPADYPGHTIYIRGLFENDLDWLPQFARKLVEVGFPEDVAISSHVNKDRDRNEDFRKTVEELLQEANGV